MFRCHRRVHELTVAGPGGRGCIAQPRSRTLDTEETGALPFALHLCYSLCYYKRFCIPAAAQVNTCAMPWMGPRHTGQRSPRSWAHTSHTHICMHGCTIRSLGASMHTTHCASSGAAAGGGACDADAADADSAGQKRQATSRAAAGRRGDAVRGVHGRAQESRGAAVHAHVRV